MTNDAFEAEAERLLEWLAVFPPGPSLARAAEVAFPAWWAEVSPGLRTWPRPIDTAIVAGALADRLGFAFAAGYHAALRALIPSLPSEALVSLCITEVGGAHPRAIQTTLRPAAATGRGAWTLSGRKQWATLSTAASTLVIAASMGTDRKGRNRIRMVRVEADRPGIRVVAMPPTPFAPEIEHGQIHLDDVRLSDGDLLDGDGYDDYIKPFRTIEDLHVNGALLGYLHAVAARFDWPRPVREVLLSQIALVRALSFLDERSAWVHLALGGFFSTQRWLLEDVEPHWQQADKATRSRWQRDRALLDVAGRARGLRLEAAWRRLEAQAEGGETR